LSWHGFDIYVFIPWWFDIGLKMRTFAKHFTINAHVKASSDGGCGGDDTDWQELLIIPLPSSSLA
jgi:hypothetical protein